MLLPTPGSDSEYQLLDTGDGQRLEQWGSFRLARPDPQIIWPKSLPEDDWQQAGAVFVAGRGEDKGRWKTNKELPPHWPVNIGQLKLVAKLSPFKHTGIFPEQAVQWDWMGRHVAGQGRLKILNLFGYTGGATLALAKAGCFVTHVDASKPSLTWARENQQINGVSPTSVRWILDDAVKFVKRELKRQSFYDGILMDPPAFGHGPTGATWKFNRDLPALLNDCVHLLTPQARFIVINGYATNSSALALNNVLEDALQGRPADIEFGELCLKQKTGRLISTGIFARAAL